MHESPRHPGLGSALFRVRSWFARRPVTAAALALLLVGVAAAAPRALRPPRDPDAIQKALAEGPHAGECERCHTMHGQDQGAVYPNALVGPDDNTLCFRCHTTPWAGGSLADDPLYRATGHGSSTVMIWPGPDPAMRVEMDAPTKCVNCHDPHGWSDASGQIPMLAVQREERLCVTCHDGSPAATDIGNELRKPYRHPTSDYTGRHAGPGESNPNDFGVTPVNLRHAECEDCHNPHVSREQRANLDGNSDASKATLGVSRVAVINGAAGSRPSYSFLAAADTLTAPNTEYQLCFKCHSSWTNQPVGQTDFGVVLNPANPSFHPVEDMGRNLSISAMAFTAGWGSTSITRCGSCHGSDFGGIAGPHGSTNRYILRQPYTTSSADRTMSPDELCFSCHSFDVYANASSPEQVRAASRFNAPGAGKGHAEHVGEARVPCYACHVTHGSTSQPYLISLNRTPGLLWYTPNSSGGTCGPTCHGSESYTVNYAR